VGIAVPEASVKNLLFIKEIYSNWAISQGYRGALM
jgi:hypothetical protein